MIIPAIRDLDKDFNSSNTLSGTLSFDTIILKDFNFLELISELEIEPIFPLKLKVEIYHFTLKKSLESKLIEVRVHIFFNI